MGVGDPLSQVGDEALLAAGALGPSGVAVVVGPRRSDAVALAAAIADVLVLDGVAQTTPVRATLALLAVDSVDPWGRAVALPPGGDLRAPRAVLLGACDMVVAVGDESSNSSISLRARLELGDGVRLGADRVDWRTLASKRLGLLTAMARPDRVVRALERRGLRIGAVVRAPDHGPFPPEAVERARRMPVDLWLTTAKCAFHVFAPVALSHVRLARSRGAGRGSGAWSGAWSSALSGKGSGGSGGRGHRCALHPAGRAVARAPASLRLDLTFRGP